MDKNQEIELIVKDREHYLNEYREACELIRIELKIRRVALAFVVAVQYGIITVLFRTVELPVELGWAKFVFLPLVAIFITIVGINNEWRIKQYLNEYGARARLLEEGLGFDLLRNAYSKVAEREGFWTGKAYRWFMGFYALLIILWAVYLGAALCCRWWV